MVASRASLVHGFTRLRFLVDQVYLFTRLLSLQLCAKGARTRYNGWEDGAQGVEVAGRVGEDARGREGRADDELCH